VGSAAASAEPSLAKLHCPAHCCLPAAPRHSWHHTLQQHQQLQQGAHCHGAAAVAFSGCLPPSCVPWAWLVLLLLLDRLLQQQQQQQQQQLLLLFWLACGSRTVKGGHPKNDLSLSRATRSPKNGHTDQQIFT
jgi:hypothetical protein